MPTARKAAATPSAKSEPTTKAAAKAPAKKAGAESTTTAPAKAAAKKTAKTTTAAKSAAPAKATTAAKAPAKATPAKEPAAEAKPGTAKPASQPSALPVAPGETPWDQAEVEELRDDLNAEIERLQAGIKQAEEELAELLQEGGDGAGRDPADVGSANFERDQEMSLHANLREMLEQSEHALQRLDAGTYGLCEVCGEPIGKGRLQAFPRATMCVTCKQREERR